MPALVDPMRASSAVIDTAFGSASALPAAKNIFVVALSLAIFAVADRILQIIHDMIVAATDLQPLEAMAHLFSTIKIMFELDGRPVSPVLAQVFDESRCARNMIFV